MSRRLETLVPGTPVFCGDRRVGSIEGVYTEGDSRLPEYIGVRWESRAATILIPTNDVQSLESIGVILQSMDPAVYETIAAFDPKASPTIKKLA